MTDPTDRRPGLPAADLHERIREAAFALLLTERKPIEAAEIASTTGVSAGTLPAMLDQLARAGWIDRDEGRRVTGSAGLSLTSGPHRIAIHGSEFRTWCAYDSIGPSWRAPSAAGRRSLPPRSPSRHRSSQGPCPSGHPSL